MTESLPPTPETPEAPLQVTMDIQQLAKMMAEESAKAVQDGLATIGLYKTRGEVVAKDADEHVQVRRETALNDDGSAGDPDPGFYPVPSPGVLPQVGDTVWCVGNNGGLVVLGKEADAAYKDLPAVLAVANLALAQPPIGVSMDWNGASDPADGKWLIEDGRVLNSADYPTLFAVLGTAFNTGGEAASQFRIPDKRGRTSVGAGQGTGLTNRDRATRFGAETVQLLTSEMPSHGHTVSQDAAGGHSHGGFTGYADLTHSHSITHIVHTITSASQTVQSGSGASVADTFTWDHSDPGSTNGALDLHRHVIGDVSDHNHSVSIGNTGGGGSHTNVQPSIARHSIIRVLL